MTTIKLRKRFQDYIGTWEELNAAIINGVTYTLWESDWGEDALSIITADGKVIIDDSRNGLVVDLGDYLGMEYEVVEKHIID